MEDPTTLSPPSWEKRRAWAWRTRHWHTTVDEADADAAMQDMPELPQRQLDDVFLDASPRNKIQGWLQDCGSSMEILPEEGCLPVISGAISHGNSFEDDLTLGAEAMLLPGIYKATNKRDLLDPSRCPRFLQLGNSMASSGISGGTTKTSSSITELLDMCLEDAESILYNLGFGGEQPQLAAKIPSRFFQTPSGLKGINFRVFLEAQMRRMEEDDPCLTLANRFRQVETLTTTANALFCLYAYVSKTPVQKIAPTYSFRDCWDTPDIMITAAKEEPRSPIDRLKRAVSRMCLYSPSKGGGSPQKGDREPLKKLDSLDKVVQEVLEMVREEKLKGEQRDISASVQEQTQPICSAERPQASQGRAQPVWSTDRSQASIPMEKSQASQGTTQPMVPTERLQASIPMEKSQASRGTAQAMDPTERLQASGRNTQPDAHMEKLQAWEKWSPPAGPAKRLKCQQKQHFFPEEVALVSDHEGDTEKSTDGPDFLPQGACETVPVSEASPGVSDGDSVISSEIQVLQRTNQATECITDTVSHVPEMLLDTWYSVSGHDRQCSSQKHHRSVLPSSASPLIDTRTSDTSKRIGSSEEDLFKQCPKNELDLGRPTCWRQLGISECVPSWQSQGDSQGLEGSSQPPDCSRDDFTPLEESDPEDQSHPDNPANIELIYSRDAARLHHGIEEGLSFDHERFCEDAWTSVFEKASLAERPYLQDSSFEMEEIQSNEGDLNSLVEPPHQISFSTPLSVARIRRKRFSAPTDSAQSDSSGFVEDLVLECLSQVLDLQQAGPALGSRF